MYGELPEGSRATIASAFAGRPRSAETDIAWCSAVELAYQGLTPQAPAGAIDADLPAVMAPAARARLSRRAPAGTLAPFFGDPNNQSDCQVNEVMGWRWDPARRRCVPDDDPSPSGTPSPGGGSAVRDVSDCVSQGGTVVSSGGRSICNVDGRAVPIGGDDDNTEEIVQGVVTGALGIARVVSEIVQRSDQREFQQFVLGLQNEQRRFEAQARAGDQAAAEALGRINAAIAESNARAAEANRAAAESGRAPVYPPELLALLQQKQGTPTWVWVAGGVAATAVVAALVVVATRPAPAPAPSR